MAIRCCDENKEEMADKAQHRDHRALIRPSSQGALCACVTDRES